MKWKPGRIFLWAWWIWGIMALGAAETPNTPVRVTLMPLAERLVDQLAKGAYTRAAEAFDETLSQAMPPDQLEKTWQSVVAQAGAYQMRLKSKVIRGKDFDTVFVTCAFEKTHLDIKVVFNNDDQVSGLWFSPSDTSTAYAGPAYENPNAFTELEISVGLGGYALPGTLTLPKGKAPFPAIILVHGSGPQDRDETIGPNKPFRDLALGLASQGIAVLRYDKRTKVYAAQMIALEKTLTVQQETIDDVLAAVALLKKTALIDPRAIFVLGHSLGGMLIPRIGAQAPELAGLIILAGTARPMEDVILEQLTYVLPLQGLKPEEVTQTLKQVRVQVAKVKSPKLSADTPASDLPLGIPARYWLDLRSYVPAKAMRAVPRPALILQGGRDYQVTEKDFNLWKESLGDRKDVVFKFYPNLNHLLAAGQGKATPAEYTKLNYVDPVVIEDIAAWVKKVGAH